ncbi:hypothetical protein RM543_14800 [Roseicyclus sp. F158]|uniref:DUF4258 domain-containing protein n=1 Tax=Tropicimonas omnivorans TaxID=3075590 RepID=A0ABU3DJS2_9RHOB|nr:hypothetical protein [Roseicyclus sp. F158]MDT0683957.1 hypothetical protein [Roseicyclus sp. F158]
MALGILISMLSDCGAGTGADWSVLGTEPFSPDRWEAAGTETRGTMVHEFLADHDVVGMTREDVVALLGEPTAYYDRDENLGWLVGPATVSSPYGRGYLLAMRVKKGRVTSVTAIPQLPRR